MKYNVVLQISRSPLAEGDNVIYIEKLYETDILMKAKRKEQEFIQAEALSRNDDTYTFPNPECMFVLDGTSISEIIEWTVVSFIKSKHWVALKFINGEPVLDTSTFYERKRDVVDGYPVDLLKNECRVVL